MHGYGSVSEKAPGGSVARAVAGADTAFAPSVTPHTASRNPVADSAARRLAELGDPTRTAPAYREIAAGFIRDIDTVFTHALRVPRPWLHQLVARYDRVLHEELVPRLAVDGVTFPRWDELSSLERVQMQRRFRERTFPLFSPMAVDSTHPLPRLPSLTVNVAMQVDGRLVLVTIAPHVPRLLTVQRGRYLTMEAFVGALLPRLLVGVRIAEHTAFRITRSTMADRAVRLEVESGSSTGLLDALASRLGLDGGDVYRLRSSLAMGDPLAVAPGRIAADRRPSTAGTRAQTAPRKAP